MIVGYRLKNERLEQVMFVDSVVIYTRLNDVRIRYTQEGKPRERLLTATDIEYLEVKKD